ncbi:MAG: PilN domain-containing protein [Phycisphaeraceae bacterium]
MKRIDLLPQHLHQAQAAQNRRATYGVLAGLLVVVLAGWAGAAVVQLRGLDRQIAAAEQEVTPLREAAERVATLQAERANLEAEIGTVARLRETLPTAPILALLTQIAPKEVALRGLKIQLPGPPLPERENSDERKRSPAPPPHVQIALQGLASDDVAVARMVRLLSQHHLFKNIQLDDSREVVVRDQPRQEFNLSMKLLLTQAAAMAQHDGAKP